MFNISLFVMEKYGGVSMAYIKGLYNYIVELLYPVIFKFLVSKWQSSIEEGIGSNRQTHPWIQQWHENKGNGVYNWR